MEQLGHLGHVNCCDLSGEAGLARGIQFVPKLQQVLLTKGLQAGGQLGTLGRICLRSGHQKIQPRTQP